MSTNEYNEKEILQQIHDLASTQLSLDPVHFEIEMDGEIPVVWGELPSNQDKEQLIRILHDLLDVDEIDFQLAVDEMLQGQNGSIGDSTSDSDYFPDDPDSIRSTKIQY